MQRPFHLLIKLMVAVLVFISIQGVLFAAEGASKVVQWPSMPNLDRGPGFYLSMPCILLCWLVMVLWVKTTDWISRDALQMKLPSYRYHAIAFGTFVVAMVLVWMVPYFLIAFPLLLLAHLGPLGWYIVNRNSKAEDHEKVLTAGHIRYLMSETLRPLGIKIGAEKPQPDDLGAHVVFKAQGAQSEREDRANLLAARQSSGYQATRELIALLVTTRADAAAIELTNAESGEMVLSYRIDGVWDVRTAYDYATASAIVHVLQTLATVDAEQRGNKQSGTFQATYEEVSLDCRLMCGPVKKGYRVLLRIRRQERVLANIRESGMSTKVREQLHELLHSQKGLVLFSSLPEDGLTTTVDLALESSDRLMREFVAIEEQEHRELDIENIAVSTYSAASGQTPCDALPEVIRKYPDVIVVRDLVNAETANQLCQQVTDEGRLVVTSVRAKGALDSMLRLLALKADRVVFSKAIVAAVSQRLVRRLCEECKEPYKPSPEQLKQLGLSGDKVKTLYRAGRPKAHPKKGEEEFCPHCEGIGYFGRVGMYEIALVNDEMRRVLAEQPKLQLLLEATHASKMSTIRHAGAALVAAGIISAKDLQRVLNN